jgi:hypothetical protein
MEWYSLNPQVAKKDDSENPIDAASILLLTPKKVRSRAISRQAGAGQHKDE